MMLVHHDLQTHYSFLQRERNTYETERNDEVNKKTASSGRTVRQIAHAVVISTK
jgi:hypothetical protein